MKDVKLVPVQGSMRAATVNDRVAQGSVVRTGVDSRAEITFGAGGVVRLGGKTALRSREESRHLQLEEGAVLFQVPKGLVGAKITTAGINIETAGTTGLIERYGGAYVKILVLEGTARVYLNQVGESVLVTPGQMLITKPRAATLPEPVHFEIAQLVKTSLLMTTDFAPLASRGRIEAEIRKQQSDPDFTATNLVIYGRGTLVTLVPQGSAPAKPASSPGRPNPGTNPTRRRSN